MGSLSEEEQKQGQWSCTSPDPIFRLLIGLHFNRGPRRKHSYSGCVSPPPTPTPSIDLALSQLRSLLTGVRQAPPLGWHQASAFSSSQLEIPGEIPIPWGPLFQKTDSQSGGSTNNPCRMSCLDGYRCRFRAFPPFTWFDNPPSLRDDSLYWLQQWPESSRPSLFLLYGNLQSVESDVRSSKANPGRRKLLGAWIPIIAGCLRMTVCRGALWSIPLITALRGWRLWQWPD